MNATLSPRHPLRERFFFGLGMVILPPFWAWWTLRRRFTLRQQALAFLWANLYLLIILLAWRYTGQHIQAIIVGHRHILSVEILSLSAWLLFRLFNIAMIVLTDIIAEVSSIVGPAYMRRAQHHPTLALWFPLLGFLGVIFFHLILEPLGRFNARCNRRFWSWFTR